MFLQRPSAAVSRSLPAPKQKGRREAGPPCERHAMAGKRITLRQRARVIERSFPYPE